MELTYQHIRARLTVRDLIDMVRLSQFWQRWLVSMSRTKQSTRLHPCGREVQAGGVFAKLAGLRSSRFAQVASAGCRVKLSIECLERH